MFIETSFETIDDVLQKLKPFYDATQGKITINANLRGSVDFSVLERFEYKNVKSIIIENIHKNGQIYEILNLPSSLEIFKCENQMLKNIYNFPSSIKELYLKYNQIKTLDLFSMKNVEILNVSHNEIENIENIPKNIRELNCDTNHLKKLDIKGLFSLKKLNVSNNPNIILDYFDDAPLDEFLSDNNPYMQIIHKKTPEFQGGKRKKVIIEYEDALHQYFKMKNNYEKKMKEKMTKRKKPIPLCLKCKKEGGTLFEKRDNSYIALCGNKENPCSLHIEIYNGMYRDNDFVLKMYNDELEKLKMEIIQEKMNTVFNFESEKSVAKKFKTKINNYMIYNEKFNEIFEHNEKLLKNEEKRELIKIKTNQMYELSNVLNIMMKKYENEGNHEILSHAMNMYVSEFLPIVEELRTLKYGIMEMNSNVLFQRYSDIHNYEYNLDKNKPKVVHFDV